jgi:hypothetical protein
MTKGNERLPHESHGGYRKRLAREKKYIKGWLRGRRIWNPMARGTYVRKLHGEIRSSNNV